MDYVYIYESHLGGYFISSEDLDYEDLYCDECGDSDTLVYYGTPDEIFEQVLANLTEAKERQEIKELGVDLPYDDEAYEVEEAQWEYDTVYELLKPYLEKKED